MIKLVLLAVCVVYVAGTCNQQAIIDNCQTFAQEMQDPNRQNDKTAMCKTLDAYMACIEDAGCSEDQTYATALDSMKTTREKMECSSATSLFSSVTTLILASLAFLMSKY